jgi:cobalt/nickel transport protein
MRFCVVFSFKEDSMKKISMIVLLAVASVFSALPVSAHFGMIIPSDTMVLPDDDRTIHLTFSFSHPFEGIGMNLVKPKTCAVMVNGAPQDLTNTLTPTQVMQHHAWQLDYAIKRPGVYMFYMEPQPYWEPAEDSFIIHYTKTVVTAFGNDEGWDQAIGLKTEIVPLSKPYGLYKGNVFQGIVMLNGKPVPYSEVEVEYYNEDLTATAPTDYMITQTIKADANGVFTYAAPRAGWWGFAALNSADFTLTHDGKEKNVEIGAVIWVKFHKI